MAAIHTLRGVAAHRLAEFDARFLAAQKRTDLTKIFHKPWEVLARVAHERGLVNPALAANKHVPAIDPDLPRGPWQAHHQQMLAKYTQQCPACRVRLLRVAFAPGVCPECGAAIKQAESRRRVRTRN